MKTIIATLALLFAFTCSYGQTAGLAITNNTPANISFHCAVGNNCNIMTHVNVTVPAFTTVGVPAIIPGPTVEWIGIHGYDVNGTPVWQPYPNYFLNGTFCLPPSTAFTAIWSSNNDVSIN